MAEAWTRILTSPDLPARQATVDFEVPARK
jgi:hypothetical protein